MESLEGFVSDDELLLDPLARRGWEVEMVPWRRPGVEWSRFRAVLVRTTWDYPDDPEGFLGALESVDRSPALLLNPLELIRWNVEKTYLRDLEARGVPVVPTAWGRGLTREALARHRRELQAERMVVKPVVGANASRLHRLDPDEDEAEERAIRSLGDRPYLAQPFVPGVVEEGEYSLFYFGGALSHAILKSPTESDFRVQEEHGGRIRAVGAGPDLLAAGERVMESVRPVPLYARVDVVPMADGGYALMELELVEPALYFRMDSRAPDRFVKAFLAFVDEGKAPSRAGSRPAETGRGP